LQLFCLGFKLISEPGNLILIILQKLIQNQNGLKYKLPLDVWKL